MDTPASAPDSPLLSAHRLVVRFRLGWRKSLKAVDDLSVRFSPGETFGLIGESGSGKSTLGRALLGLVPADAGEIAWRGTPLRRLRKDGRREFREKVQMVFQDPHSALDPRRKIIKSVREPLDVTKKTPPAERRRLAAELLDRVGLTREQGERYPHELSGGQKQRANIARALVSGPDVLVCDEAVSALDVAIQAEILNLLQDLRTELGLTLVFISHDLAVVTHVADRLGVMYLGSLIECGEAASVAESPGHPYTEALISSQPRPLPSHLRTGGRILLTGDVPSPVNPPSGCRFRTRCRYAEARCAAEVPQAHTVTTGHEAFCHFTGSLELRGDHPQRRSMAPYRTGTADATDADNAAPDAAGRSQAPASWRRG